MVQGALTTFRSFASASIYILHPGFKFFSIVIAPISYYVNGFYMILFGKKYIKKLYRTGPLAD